VPRTARVPSGGFVYHILNRSVGRMHMFCKVSDSEAFERVIVDAHPRQPIRNLSYCVLVIAFAVATAGELDGSRQRSFDHEGLRPSAGEHRKRTTRWRRDVGAGNGKRSRIGADRSSGRRPTERAPIGDRGDKLITRIGFHPAVRLADKAIAARFPSRGPVFVPRPSQPRAHRGVMIRRHAPGFQADCGPVANGKGLAKPRSSPRSC
jgi:hypothetical protein